MINLMYVVLMAMLAMNVSTQVLDGFSIVEESLQRSTDNSAKENQSIYGNFAEQMKSNPEKVREWFEKATAVKRMSDSLYNFAQELKVEIVREADGADGDIHNIERKDDLEAASHVMLAPGTGKGKKLFDAINSFRERILKMLPDAAQHKIIAGNLSTTLPKNAKTMGKNWQEYMFEDMPVAAAVTLLTKLQNDVRYAEGEVLHTLVANIDMKDIRVNKLSAFVIPNAQTIVRGDKFSAQIVMAAVDTTQQPKIYIGGRQMNLRNNTYEIVTGRTGEFNLAGYITMQNGQGDVIRRDFTQKYTVVDPSATVSADLMNVLYAGYTNPISISIPGVPLNKVTGDASVFGDEWLQAVRNILRVFREQQRKQGLGSYRFQRETEDQLNRRLHKAGRNVTLNLGGSYRDSESESFSRSEINYYQRKTSDFNNQYTTSPSTSYDFRTRLSYSEPIIGALNLQMSYQFQYRYSDNDRSMYSIASSIM